MSLGIVGDAGVRANAQQPKLFVGMILILIFAEALALYGLIGEPCQQACKRGWHVAEHTHASCPAVIMRGSLHAATIVDVLSHGISHSCLSRSWHHLGFQGWHCLTHVMGLAHLPNGSSPSAIPLLFLILGAQCRLQQYVIMVCTAHTATMK